MTESATFRGFRILLSIIAIAFCSTAVADSWTFPAERVEKTFVFGDTKIVRIRDARTDQKFPEFTLQIFEKDQLRTQVQRVSFERIFASPDQRVFVGLSNAGIPGTAVVVFDRHGAIVLLVNHGIAQFDYCDESVTLVRRWYDEGNPQVTFPSDGKTTGTSGITLRDCRGETVDLLDVVLKAYSTTVQRTLRDSAKHRP